MPEPLLLHSMNEFRDILLHCLEIAQARQVVEVGAEFGGTSSTLNEWLQARGGHLWCVDPAPKPEFLAWVDHAPGVTHVAQPSLEALPQVPCADAWCVDGDHNWYTVFHELECIFTRCAEHGKPPLIFLHDVGWPWARRDLYYAPQHIPAAFRHPHSFDAGVTLDCHHLLPGRGFRGGSSFAIAHHEGGPRNGVLTAIEDAVTAQVAAGRKVAWCMVPAVFGLGILFDAAAPWADAMIRFLLPFHENTLMATLERNRLRNYLRVIEMQDEAASLG